MVKVLAFDVGGANTKAAYITTQNGKILSALVAVEYFPVWRNPQELPIVLLTLKNRLGVDKIDGVGLTMTAELSDAYQTKRQGVRHILDCTKQAFATVPIYVLNSDSQLELFEVALTVPLRVAAANWAATGWLVAKHINNCVVVDVGSTSTSIIPIIRGRVAARGKTDLAKLIVGELVYTGSLRTNVAAIVHSVPMKKGVATVSSELFALSGDVHIVLGNLREEEYTSETTDGRGKTATEALARLARVVCADTEMLTTQEIYKLAEYIYRQQIQHIAEGLTKVYSNTKQHIEGKVPVVVTGLGKNFLARKAAETLGIDPIMDITEIVGSEAGLATPAYGVSFMVAQILEGEKKP